ncbi:MULTISPECIES: hypothetical protein [Fusobacterium]|jgi:hypothetical protein|uniref:hypothetical protein n=1 Tax=Fusobacterium TaxID=848 RepID=UPI000E46ADB5|nr:MULTISPECIES: hypothetical protein [Fusobacterium]RGY61925.1 hypothetical protein DXA30_13265 [Fusobacterium ulcerans]
MTRDELRKMYTYLKKEVGIDGYPARKLRTKEECEEAIRGLVCGTRSNTFKNYKRVIDENIKLLKEKKQLKLELENLKNKKWWQIWK